MWLGDHSLVGLLLVLMSLLKPRRTAPVAYICAWLDTDFFMRKGTGLDYFALRSSSCILLIILRKVAVQKYTCQLIRLQLEVQRDVLALSSTKSAAFFPAPWNYKEREWRGLLYTLQVLLCLGTLFGFSQPSKSLQLFSLEKLNA